MTILRELVKGRKLLYDIPRKDEAAYNLPIAPKLLKRSFAEVVPCRADYALEQAIAQEEEEVGKLFSQCNPPFQYAWYEVREGNATLDQPFAIMSRATRVDDCCDKAWRLSLDLVMSLNRNYVVMVNTTCVVSDGCLIKDAEGNAFWNAFNKSAMREYSLDWNVEIDREALRSLGQMNVRTVLTWNEIANSPTVRVARFDPRPRRKRKRSKPGIVWRELVISKGVHRGVALRPTQRHTEESRASRVHLVRGHFKDYRRGRGLFGKYRKKVWCPQFARGEEGRGAIVKTYSEEP